MSIRRIFKLALHWQVLIAGILGLGAGLLIHLAPEVAPKGLPEGADPMLREHWIAPCDYVADLFLRLLKMLIVPLIFSSVVSGVVSVGKLGALGRIGLKTLAYYIASSLVAILIGLALVNLIAPGEGADLDFRQLVQKEDLPTDQNLWGIFKRMVPENLFGALSTNGLILQVIFFAVLLGICITRIERVQRDLMTRFFEALFSAMTGMAEIVIRLVPIGVFALVARVVGSSGVSAFASLAWLMVTVVAALAIHALVVLPVVLRVLARVSPLKWAGAVWPALIMAFSTSSSSATLPVTLRSVTERGGVRQRVASFTLPLGATVNMDGTALYECVGVIFLAQYYAGVSDFELTFVMQATVVLTALLASIGAAGIPSAGTVMMAMILSQLKLPDEGIALLLVIDRPLDMLRTAVNIWSDTVCAAVIGRSEGELEAPS